MISWITNWAQAIIIAVIIATIIEMILPEGTSKKYIKVVIGVYILFTIISPVISKFTGKSISVSDLIDLNQYIEEVKEKEKTQNLLQENNQTSIREIYIGSLKSDIQTKLKGKGYIVTSIVLDVGNDDNYTLNKITLSIKKSENNDEEESDKPNNSAEQQSNETDINITNSISTVNEIQINVSNSTSTEDTQQNSSIYNNLLLNSDKKKIKEYLSSVYEINERNIVINE